MLSRTVIFFCQMTFLRDMEKDPFLMADPDPQHCIKYLLYSQLRTLQGSHINEAIVVNYYHVDHSTKSDKQGS